jgi:hypothetical protein
MGRPRLVQQIVRQRFLVTLDGEESFEGVLTDWDAGFFVFQDAWSLTPAGDRIRLDTALWVPRPRIKYMQIVNP